MTTQTEALKLALEAFKKIRNDKYSHWEVDQEIDAINEALAQPEREQEPVGMVKDLFTNAAWDKLDVLGSTKVYLSTPPQRKPLTHEQRFDLLTKFEPHKNKWEAPAILIDMVEAAHGIKE